MKMGIVKITPILIKDALGFPADWKIESMRMNFNDNCITAVISGSDFPETAIDEIKECEVVIHKENIRFEVKVKE